jgi:hypothetical protein
MIVVMKKICRRFFLVLLIACIINGIILWLIFGINPKKAQTKLPKTITIERIIETKKPDDSPTSLPTMLPSPVAVPITPNLEPAQEPTDQVPEQDSMQAQNNDNKLDHKSELTSTTKETSSKQNQDLQSAKKPRRKKRVITQPQFDFDRINTYALAAGSSAFKNYGTNKIADELDYLILTYQEKARKHFAVALNSYADSNYFYNISVTQFNISIIIEQDGRAQFKAHNIANNIAIANLIEKILIYAGLFPAIPKNLKINNFRLDFNIRIDQGKLVRGYGWN